MFFKKKNHINVITRKQIKKNEKVLRSLKEHDEGKKTISTSNIERSLTRV
jgi:hypothetical protein